MVSGTQTQQIPTPVATVALLITHSLVLLELGYLHTSVFPFTRPDTTRHSSSATIEDAWAFQACSAKLLRMNDIEMTGNAAAERRNQM